jgi:hypothetical protein
MAGWDAFLAMFDYELTQSAEEDKDPGDIASLRADAKAAGDDEEKLAGIWASMVDLPVRNDFPFREPSDLRGIRAARRTGVRSLALPYGDNELYDRLYGAWLARCAGCALGKPVEGFMGAPNTAWRSPTR